ncbi:MAG TPA: hypothetical protein VK702_03290 [Candidatus Acidoferrum sp.]|nr:hypothetical protein [Candidatus Acidoferrum sp.]
MSSRPSSRRGAAAIACLLAVFATYVPARGQTADDNTRVLALLNGQSCAVHEARLFAQEVGQAQEPEGSRYVAQFQVTPSPSPSGSPSPFATPSFAPHTGATTQLVATPQPSGSPVTPPPIPTASPNPFDQNQPVFVERGGDTPPPITPAGQPLPTASPKPSASPTTKPTLPPNYIAVLADKVSGNTGPGKPGDASGNVHILYGAEEIVGDDAHYDGLRTVTITGHPFIINHARDSVLQADKITFDTIDQTAILTNGRGTSSEGVNVGLVHFNAKDLHTDAEGVGHGLAPSVTTCEHERGGYHITGRNMDVYPGDKIVIYKAILWLGAAAVFFLPKVVIPLRTVDNPDQRPKYFPDVGYDSYEGFWIKTRTTFGKDQYFYGYYVVNYFTKVGLGLGYVAFYTKKNGRRSANVNFYEIHDKRVDQTTDNLTFGETENFSQTLRSNFQLSYQSNFGPYTDLPSTTQVSETIAHQTAHTSQQYSYTRSTTGSQSSSNSFSFTDNDQFNSHLSNAFNLNVSSSSTNYGGNASTNSTATVNDLLHYVTPSYDYQLTYDKTIAAQPYGDDEVPQLQIKPYKFFPHFVIPMSANFTVGEYSEPAYDFSASRANMAFVLGPEIANIYGSDLQATVNVNQYAYSTGDLKASIQQQASLTTPISQHFVNTLTYSEENYNGPASVPFYTLDQFPGVNTKNAQDLVRVLNGNTYNLAVGFATNFIPEAQPVSYQLTVQPSPRSLVLLGGSFIPGPGQGFETTNLQLSTPLGRDTQAQFVTTIDWLNHARLEQKVLYITRTIGNCYQLQGLYNESQKLVTFQINILAFPNQGATFALGQGGPLIPTSFNNL